MHAAPPQTRSHLLCVAPMMDWTDRHCRFFHRLIAPHALLYSEMITTGAILFGDRERLLGFHPDEHPVALQLGGSEPEDLARAARIGEEWGYDEINLNCGCPSERVQRGAFGACLMREPKLVAQCIEAMREVVDIPVTVKHRLGVDDQTDYGFVRDFVGALYEAGCRVFLVHARSAVLKGLSPKENREIPPLRMQMVRELKREFPAATIVANGGIASVEQVDGLLRADGTLPGLDGVMLGRAAYHDPWLLRALDGILFSAPSFAYPTRESVLAPLEDYFHREVSRGVQPKSMTRHWHGLFHGQAGARAWRRQICEGLSPVTAFESALREARTPIKTAPHSSMESPSQPQASNISVSESPATLTSASQT
ncbi:MAG: tRNA dihydrouridine(20/20a) synthase DusA [Betaproteobacteria bacterium]|nr:tRNA dihydrouridine(20/20a) synthase DusA [Betaproteobacteria bacterium]